MTWNLGRRYASGVFAVAIALFIGPGPLAADSSTHAESVGFGCPFAFATVVQQVFGSYTFAMHGAGSVSGKGYQDVPFVGSGIGCQFRRGTEGMVVTEAIMDSPAKAAQAFQDGLYHVSRPKSFGSVTLADAPGHVIGYHGTDVVDVVWRVFPGGRIKQNISQTALDPIAIAALCNSASPSVLRSGC